MRFSLRGERSKAIAIFALFGWILVGQLSAQLPTIQFASTISSGGEQISLANLELQLSEISASDVTVNYIVSGGTAIGGGVDYLLAAGVATITAGNLTTYIQVTIIDDALDENDETILVTISDPTNATLGVNTTHTYTILDNDDPPTVTLNLTGSPLAENGGVATVTATLSALSGLDVTVNLAFDGTATLTADYTRSGSQIVIPAGSLSENITIAGQDDAIDESDETVIVDIDSVINGIESGVQQVVLTIIDDDIQSFVTSVDQVNVPEGGTAQFQVRLTAQPGSDVAVTVARASGDTDITVQTPSLTFTPANWNVYQGVTLAAAEDADIQNSQAVIRLSAAGVPNKDITATEQDNDTLQFETNVDALSVPEGSTAQFQVRLTAQPGSDVAVTVARASGDADITVQTPSLTFTPANWNVYQGVTLAAAEDADIQNSQAVIRLSAVGIADKDILATEQDNDTLQFETNVDALSVPEGSTAQFQVRLTAEPGSDVAVTVARASGDTDITVQTPSLTFTPANWNVYQGVTLAAAEDADIQNSQAVIRLSAVGVPNKEITATEQDDDVDNGAIAIILSPAESTSGLFVNVAIQISNNPNSVGAFGLDFVFDTTFFVYKASSLGSLTSNWSLSVNSIAPGKLRLSSVGGTIIPPASSGILINLNLQVQCLSLPEQTISQVRIENYTDDLYDEFLPLPCTTNFTFHPCSILGDANKSGTITPGDAQGAFEIYLGILAPDFCQQMTADANCSQSVTPGDAQMIFEHYLGLRTLPLCCTAVSSSSMEFSAQDRTQIQDQWILQENPDSDSKDAAGKSRRESGRSSFERKDGRAETISRRKLYPLDTIGRPGDMVNIPILISNPEGIERFGFDVNYPIEILEFVGWQRTFLTQKFHDLSGEEGVPGTVRVEGESRIGISQNDLGALVMLVFRVKDGEDVSLPLEVYNPRGDISSADVRGASFLRMRDYPTESRFIGFGEPSISQGNMVRVPVLVSSLFRLKAFGFEVKYATDRLDFLSLLGQESGEDILHLRAVEIHPGLIRIGGFRLNESHERGPGELVGLLFRWKQKEAEISLGQLVDDIASAIIFKDSLKIK